MSPCTRRMVALALAATALGVAGRAGAQGAADFPNRPVKLVVPFAAGGVADATARLLAQKLQETWQQPVVVENRTGGGGTIGATAVARAPADGYTVLLGVSALTLQPLLSDKAQYDPYRDFTPITLIARLPILLCVPIDSPHRTLDEFMAHAKASRNALSVGNYGVGTASHLLGLILNRQAGADATQVPYQGSAPLISALIGGQIQAGFVDSATARPHAGKLRFLAVTGTSRVPGLPNVPTFAERGHRSFEQDGWLGILVPARTPEAAVERISGALARAMASPDVAARIEALGIAPVGGPSTELVRIMRGDSEVYGKVIRDNGIRLD